MNLREQAAIDAQSFLEDSSTGFGWDVEITDPDGETAIITGFSTDIHTTIDPETGQAVSGRRASVSLSLASLSAAGLGIPRGIAETNRKPWVITFDDIEGHAHTFKVEESMPDRAIGVVVCMLTAYVQL